jgi:hypothetical protein
MKSNGSCNNEMKPNKSNGWMLDGLIRFHNKTEQKRRLIFFLVENVFGKDDRWGKYVKGWTDG